MNPTLTPSRPSARSAPRQVVRSLLGALSTFVVAMAVGLGIALIVGATLLFNILVWLTFTVLWVAFAAALVLSPGTLDAIWRSGRELPLLVQVVIGLLFLPITIGLWVWEQAWALPIRLALVMAIGVWNVFLFFPRG